MSDHGDAQGWRAWVGSSADDPVTLYLSEIERVPPVSEGEAAELLRLVTAGNQEALQRLTEGNLRLVVIAVKDYAHREVDLIELFQVGNVGLVRAIAKVSQMPSGMAFRAFAMHEIRRSIDERLADN